MSLKIMAAYAAVLSLMHTIDQLELHPSPPISLDKQQVQSLTKKLTYLQNFLEGYSSPVADSDEADPLEMRIADAAYEVEDAIESYIVENIHLAAATDHHLDDDDDEQIAVEEISCIHFYQDLEKVIEGIDMITREVAEMVRDDKAAVEPQMQRNVSAHASFRSSSTSIVRKSEMVGFDDLLLQLLDRLTGGRSNRQIIPIVGMGGIGKTTLAKNVLENALVKEYFDICVWATISQDYNIQETLIEVISQAGGYSGSKSENELGEALHKHLWGSRYLVIMDDMWSLEAWEKINFFFPDCNNGSRILVTTRMSNLGSHLTDSNSLDIRFLDADNSWKLFSKTVFGEECFPRELKKTGEKIVKSCHGLPLAIVVIGGLLAESQHTQEYWGHVEKNLNSIVNSENDECCLRILKMSYNHLPAYLKPCFLYMGLFEEDREIRVSVLINLWISEGFVKPINNKNFETIGEKYLNELVDRNLVMVHKLGARGKIKYCKVHDLLRDLSLKEARKQRFYHVYGQHSARGLDREHVIVIPNNSSKEEVLDALESMSRARSYVCHNYRISKLPNSRLLRTLKTSETRTTMGYCEYYLEDVLQFVNLRYLASVVTPKKSEIHSSINQLWNLHSLSISFARVVAPIEIWKMVQLRRVEFSYGRLCLPDPPSCNSNTVVMENLETIKELKNFNLNEEVVKRIPNIKKLYLTYEGERIERVDCLRYLQCLSKLETLCCSTTYGRDEYLQWISFPRSLKKLNLFASYRCNDFELEHILKRIGSLPLLEKLVLQYGSFRTRKWETIDGQFPSLKLLKLDRCRFLENWTMSESFPLLQELHLEGLHSLVEIPSEIVEIPTLKSNALEFCNESVVRSAKRIVEEQEDLYGEQLDLRVRVKLLSQQKELQRLASPNFEVELTTIDGHG